MTTATVNSEPTEAMKRALELHRAGRSSEAREVISDSADQTRRRFGAGSLADVLAQTELGSILWGVGELEAAAAAFREACAPPPADEQALRDRLTNLMSLGQVLGLAGQYEEAKKALLEGLAGREQYYGRQHAGYAFGLEPLAQLTFNSGHTSVALDMLEEVIGNYWRNGHPRVANAIAIRAEIIKAAGLDTPAFTRVKDLPAEIVKQILDRLNERVGHWPDLTVNRRVFADLLQAVTFKFGETHQLVLELCTTISNVERKLGSAGDQALRQNIIRRAIGLNDRLNRPREALVAAQALALAQSDAGQFEDAANSYEESRVRAIGIGDPILLAKVLRNLGLLLLQVGPADIAEAHLKEAVNVAQSTGDMVALGRAQVALGVLHQHAGDAKQAIPVLNRAVANLGPAHADSLTARAHLHAIEAGGPCGCDDTTHVIPAAFRDFVMRRLPSDLLERLDVELKDGDFEVGVHVMRTPSPDEVANIEQVIHDALHEFRGRLARQA